METKTEKLPQDRMRWVRPIISVSMAGTLIYGFIVKQIPWEAFVPIAVSAIGWWYYQRGQEKKLGLPVIK